MRCILCTLIHTQLTGHLRPVKTAGFGVPMKAALPGPKVKSSSFIGKPVKVTLLRQSEVELDSVPSGLTQNLGW